MIYGIYLGLYIWELDGIYGISYGIYLRFFTIYDIHFRFIWIQWEFIWGFIDIHLGFVAFIWNLWDWWDSFGIYGIKFGISIRIYWDSWDSWEFWYLWDFFQIFFGSIEIIFKIFLNLKCSTFNLFSNFLNYEWALEETKIWCQRV